LSPIFSQGQKQNVKMLSGTLYRLKIVTAKQSKVFPSSINVTLNFDNQKILGTECSLS